MAVRVTRTDPMLGIGSHEPPARPLSVEVFPDWKEAFEYLRGLSVPLTTDHEAEIRTHTDTQFSRSEVINTGLSVYSARVHYDIRAVE